MRSLAWVLVLVLVVAACGGDDDGAPTGDARATADGAAVPDGPAGGDGGGATTDAQTMSTMIGPGGGTVVSPDGVTIVIPPGALAGDTAITVTRVADSSMGTVGPVFELGPDGTTFAAPVTLTLPYDAALAGGSELMLGMDLGGGSWSGQGYAVVDAGGHTVSGTIRHFSRWAIIPSLEVCSLNYACFSSCCGVPEPLQCCNGGRSTCWCTGGAPFHDFVGCYADCVGAPMTSNFANSTCMSGCCTAQGGTANNGACMVDTMAEAQAVLTCGLGCGATGDEASLCSTATLEFDACTWNAFMMPGVGGECDMSSGLSSQFLRTIGTTIIPQTWGSPAVVNVTGGAYNASTLNTSLTCATGMPGSGSMTASWTGANFVGTWTFEMSSGNVTFSKAW